MTAQSMKERAAQQREHMLTVIEDLIAANGYSPSQPEIASATGLSLRTVGTYVRDLLKEGRLVGGEKPRTIRLP